MLFFNGQQKFDFRAAFCRSLEILFQVHLNDLWYSNPDKNAAQNKMGFSGVGKTVMFLLNRF